MYDQYSNYIFLLGDNTYMNYGLKCISGEPNESTRNLSSSDFEKIIRKKYENQFLNIPEFKRLVDKMIGENGFYAIWDDHDFDWNDCAGIKVPLDKKEISRNLFHKFTNCTTNYSYVYYHIDTPKVRVIFINNRFDSEEKG
jgi:hypothetical protein